MKKKLILIFFILNAIVLKGAKTADYMIYRLINNINYNNNSRAANSSSYNKVSILIKGKNIEGLIKNYGGKVNSSIGNIYYTCEIDKSNLQDILKHNEIEYISMAKQLHLSLNRATRIINSDIPHTAGYTGSKVLIGIIDSGIYFQHSMFKDSTGKTRLLYLWDQTDTANTGTGSINYKYLYGREWTQWEINAGICTEDDNEIGHGTHVAGIAAGNSALSGVAPEGNIIFVKAILDTSHLIDAVTYLTEIADKLNRPIVINLSLGIKYGPHDGSDLFSRSLSALTGPGKIIVKAAGNNGSDSEFIHYRINSLSPYKTTNIKITTPIRTINTSGSNYIKIDTWYDGDDKIAGAILTNNYVFTKCSYHSSSVKISRYATVSIYNATYGQDILNNDNEMLVIMDDSENSDLSSIFQCDFAIKFSNTLNTATKPIDIWITDNSIKAYFTDSDASYSLDSDSCASNLIVVGASVSRNTFTNIENTALVVNSGDVNDIAVFSSQGPTRIGGYKPDIAAPGSIILSALVPALKYSYYKYIDHNYTDYVYMQGTSMATPMVTGAVALLLERNQYLTPTDIINYFKNYSQNSGIYKTDAGVWDKKFGWGLLDLSNILNINKNEPTGNISLVASDNKLVIFRNIITTSGNAATIIMINSAGNYNINIYNLLGEKVYEFQKHNFNKGDVLSWNGTDNNSEQLEPGLYYIVEENNKIIKKVLIKK